MSDPYLDNGWALATFLDHFFLIQEFVENHPDLVSKAKGYALSCLEGQDKTHCVDIIVLDSDCGGVNQTRNCVSCNKKILVCYKHDKKYPIPINIPNLSIPHPPGYVGIHRAVCIECYDELAEPPKPSAHS